MTDCNMVSAYIEQLEAKNYEIGFQEGKGGVVQTTWLRDRDLIREKLMAAISRAAA